MAHAAIKPPPKVGTRSRLRSNIGAAVVFSMTTKATRRTTEAASEPAAVPTPSRRRRLDQRRTPARRAPH